MPMPSFPPAEGFRLRPTAAPTASPMTVDDQWAVTAYHEAGHVISYLHFSWRFGTVKIWQSDDGKVVGNVTSPAGTYDCFARAICCLSGPVAEKKLIGVSLSEQSGSYKDILMAQDALSRVDLVGHLGIDSILPFTRMMIDHEFQTIQLLANQLILHKQLDYDEVVRLVQQAV
jgi:hypothetical protein